MNKKNKKVIFIILAAVVIIVVLLLLIKGCHGADKKETIKPYVTSGTNTEESVAETMPTPEEMATESHEAATKAAEETAKAEESKAASSEAETTSESKKDETKPTVKPTEESKPTEAPKPTEKPTEATKPTEKPTEAPKPTEQPTQPVHQHTWEKVTQIVHHDAVYENRHHEATYKNVHHEATGHYQDVLVQEATPGYDEPIYEEHSFCTACGIDLTGINFMNHALDEHAGAAGYTTRRVQVGTTHHEGTPAKYEQQWVEDSPAYDEQVIDQPAWDEQVKVQEAWDEEKTIGYKCSECGATK